VIERSPELPGPSENLALLPYLNLLAASGWNAVQGRLEGWDVVLDVEEQSEVPYQTGCAYLLTMLHQSSCPEGLTTTAAQHEKLSRKLLETGGNDGWQILAGPKQFALVDGFKTVSLWVKSYPLA
jgi:hypothetical protein